MTYFKRPHNKKYEGMPVDIIADMMGKHPVDALCDLLLEEDLQVSYVIPGPNMASLPKFIAHPVSMVGSDAVLLGDYPSPRTYGCFPTSLGRSSAKRGSCRCPSHTQDDIVPCPASCIPDRGLLKDGMKADIVVFDAKEVRSPATRTEPKQFPIGIEYVIVNGNVVVDQNEHTGVLAGRAVRRGRGST